MFFSLFTLFYYTSFMTHYTTLQLQSIALLSIFFLLFLYHIRSFFHFFKHKNLLKRYRTLKKIKRLSWDGFERLTMELFRQVGWKTFGNDKKGADGGVDIWMQKTSFFHQDISAIVQCKRYDDVLVTIKVIREMYGLMHEYEVDEVYIVTTSRFTKECYRFVEGKKITLIDGELLVKYIAKFS